MGEGKRWGNHWRDICAPKLRARRAELGGPQDLPSRRIAHAVAQLTDKPSQASLVRMWLSGDREPFLSQFLALCAVLNISPHAVLGEIPEAEALSNVIRHRTAHIPPSFKKRTAARKDKKRAA